MDLPSAGWYPDPYGTPWLLRWWDGSVWTQHTHPDPNAGGAGSGGEQAGLVPATAVQSAVPATAVQSAVPATAVPATAVQSAVAGQPSTDRLRRTGPPTGRPTQPQPALPDTAGPAVYQPAVTTVQRAPVHLATGQPTIVQPGYPQPSPTALMGGADAASTQMLFPGGPSGPFPPGGPATGDNGRGPGNPFGYAQAQRRRRRWLTGGLAAGTTVAVAAIVVIALNLGGSPATTAADQTKTTPAAAATSASPSATPSASPTVSASPTATLGASVLSDGQSGLAYTQLPSPWQAGCPSSLNNGVLTWTDGESSAAGSVNGGSATWYGEACSGPLPSQYGYTGTADLQTIAQDLAQTFQNAYYSALAHNTTDETSQATSVSGHQAWESTYDVSYTNPAQGVTWPDEQAAVVVVDNGTATPAVFLVSVPQNLNEANVTTLVTSLQLTTAPAGASATATASDTSQVSGHGRGHGHRDH
jgi:Protein of unknown function (DUF2510)